MQVTQAAVQRVNVMAHKAERSVKNRNPQKKLKNLITPKNAVILERSLVTP